MTTSEQELLRVEGLQNLRDVGGLPTAEGGRTRHGRLLRSDSPHRLTEEGWRRLLGAGVRTVVDLRTTNERTGNPAGPGVPDIRSVHAPIFEDGDVFPEHLVDNVDVYSWWVHARGDAVAAALAAIADSDGPVLVHCHAGKDRTGIVVALALRLAGVPVEVVADEYALSAEMLADVLAEGMRRSREKGDTSEATLQRWFTVHRETMVDTLGRLEARYGSPGQILTALGLDSARIGRLRGLLLDEAWPAQR